MNEFLNYIVSQLTNYSKSLSKTSIFIDQPWAMVDNEFEIQKLIFKRNKELILSKNGQVKIGTWEYLPEAKSLLLDRKTDTILCNAAFIDKGVMILKLDGTENKYFALANENIIPDLDIINYLNVLRAKLLNLWISNLADGRKLEIKMAFSFLFRGDKVFISESNDSTIISSPKNGIYTLANGRQSILVEGGEFRSLLYVITYVNPYGEEIVLHTQKESVITEYDYVFVKGIPFTNGQIDLSLYKLLIMKNGKIHIKDKRSFLNRFFSRSF